MEKHGDCVRTANANETIIGFERDISLGDLIASTYTCVWLPLRLPFELELLIDLSMLRKVEQADSRSCVSLFLKLVATPDIV